MKLGSVHIPLTAKWLVVNLLRLALSAVFVFSGLVKMIDPRGVAYKVHDYLVAMGFDVSEQSLLPLVIGIALCIAEFTMGLYLFFGIRRRWTTRLTVLFLLLMTGLTLWLAVTDAVADCGCFGDAVKLTNWQTFWKNIVLLTAAIVVCLGRRQLTRVISESAQWIISMFSLAYAAFICGLCLYRLPIIDFRPYHVGQHIPTAMQWPDDPTLTPEILDFNITELSEDPEGSENSEYSEYSDYSESSESSEGPSPLPLIDQVLTDSSYTFLLIAPYLESADDGTMDRLNALYDYCMRPEHHYRFLALTASSAEAIGHWRDLTGAEYPFAFTDELTLKTMVRSNPGLILIHDGTIVGKWPRTALPRIDNPEQPLYALPLAHPQPNQHRHMLLKLLFWYLAPLLVLTLLDRAYALAKWWLQRRKTHPQLAESESLTTFAPENKQT